MVNREPNQKNVLGSIKKRFFLQNIFINTIDVIPKVIKKKEPLSELFFVPEFFKFS
jgi:hypothetical protein